MARRSSRSCSSGESVALMSVKSLLPESIYVRLLRKNFTFRPACQADRVPHALGGTTAWRWLVLLRTVVECHNRQRDRPDETRPDRTRPPLTLEDREASRALVLNPA